MRIFLAIGLALVLIFGATGKSDAGLLGFTLSNQNIKSVGIYIGGSTQWDYQAPLNNYQLNDMALDVGWSWEIYKFNVDLVPVKANLGKDNNLHFGIVLRKYFK